jgi:hypothetical protein
MARQEAASKIIENRLRRHAEGRVGALDGLRRWDSATFGGF